jgi:hypothetical protein
MNAANKSFVTFFFNIMQLISKQLNKLLMFNDVFTSPENYHSYFCSSTNFISTGSLGCKKIFSG